MSVPLRIAGAGLVALAAIVSHAVYRVWPGWRGVEIYLPASMYPAGLGHVRIDLPAERLRLEAPFGSRVVPLHSAANESQADLFQPVRGVGARWASWASGVEGAARVGSLRGRDVFVQLKPDRPLWPDGPRSMRPVSASDTPISGATNLGGHVTGVDDHGRLWLTFGSHQMPAPPEITARARPVVVERVPNRPPAAMGRAADPGTFAIFRVLPSGRAVLAGLLVDGRRIE